MDQLYIKACLTAVTGLIPLVWWILGNTQHEWEQGSHSRGCTEERALLVPQGQECPKTKTIHLEGFLSLPKGR